MEDEVKEYWELFVYHNIGYDSYKDGYHLYDTFTTEIEAKLVRDYQESQHKTKLYKVTETKHYEEVE